MKILLPDTIDLDVTAGPDDELVRYAAAERLPDAHTDADVLVVWAVPTPELQDAARRLERVRLVQTFAAGPDQVVAAGFRPEATIASGRSLHDGPVAEHALALTLAAVRRLDEHTRAQQRREWLEEVLVGQARAETAQLYTLDGARVLIWGFGSIASRLAPLFTALGARVTGVARTPGRRGDVEVVDEAGARALLPETDVLVSIVPATPATDGLFDAELFGALPPHAIFVNVGRGATVDEGALAEALRTGGLRVAAIDVTRVEPLPTDSPLWGLENLILTPHDAGNRPQGAGALLSRNLRALREGTPIVNTVER